MAKDKKNKIPTSTSKFRSILPHEPIPSHQGYLLLQGSFQVQKLLNDEKVNTITNDQLQNHLHTTFEQLNSKIKPPYKCTFIEIQTPTKIQLLYNTSYEARCVFHYLRYHSFSPYDVLLPFVQDKNLMISKKALQITQIVPRSYDDGAVEHWPRVSPPKFRRLILDKTNAKDDEELLQQQRNTTRYLYCTGIIPQSYLSSTEWNAIPKYKQPMMVLDIIRSILDPFDTSGKGVEVWPQTTKKNDCSNVYIGMRNHDDALQVMNSLSNTIQVVNNTKTKIYFDWADTITPSSYIQQLELKSNAEPSKSECTSTTSDVQVPGLILVENFISAQEENELLNLLTHGDAPWSPKQTRPSGGSVKRRVQHYGYIFDYESCNVIKDPEDFIPPPLPVSNGEEDGWNTFASIIQKLQSYTVETQTPFEKMNQITLNEYLPGQGIGSHVDTKTAFSNALASLSLSSGTVMEFKNDKKRKLVYLPPRSLLIMMDEARYDYTHGITGRMTDTINGEVLSRSTRYSLTFRTALDNTTLPCRTSSTFPLQWTFKHNNNDFKTPHCEKYHVHKVYDAIATQWNHTRSKRGGLWPCVLQFLNSLPMYSLVGDIGCGDGKYFHSDERHLTFVGCDISLPLLQTIENKSNVLVADCINLPFCNDVFDATICIAVFHHISTYKRRIQIVKELKRVTKDGRYIHIQAWAKEQQLSKSNLNEKEGKRLNKHDSLKTNFSTSDVFVPFHVQPKYLNVSAEPKNGETVAEQYAKTYKGAEYNEMKNLVVFQRYCHLYTFEELDKLIGDVGGLEICQSGYEAGNYFVVVRKIG